MPGTAYLIDSNILIRWVKPDDRHYSLVNAVIDKLIEEAHCATRRRTLANSGIRARDRLILTDTDSVSRRLIRGLE